MAHGTFPDLRANARRVLLNARTGSSYWEGRLASSALATATAVTALAVARRAGVADAAFDQLIARGIEWLVATGQADGGWGDTRDSPANISTTALVWAALAYGTGPSVRTASNAAEAWLAREAGSLEPRALATAISRRDGKDRTFSIPILTMCAIAGRLGQSAEAWSVIPRLPFELATLPRGFFRWLRLPVVSYVLPALIAMALARHRRGADPLLLQRAREMAAPRVLRVLENLQPPGGGFLEAVPLTSFVAMGLIAAGEVHHPVVSEALVFIVRSVRDDGSWPINSNLAIRLTTLSIDALAAGTGPSVLSQAECARVREWLLRQQWLREHPYTGAPSGGWAWTDLPGGVPDADDTAGALIALARLGRDDHEVRTAAAAGVRWLMDLQNRDGGIPTFCRGWGPLPFNRSGTDLTAHALRAWAAWFSAVEPARRSTVHRAMERAASFLAAAQRTDGAFVPLWFGNQSEQHQENPVYGTSRVVVGLAATNAVLGAVAAGPRGRAIRWLLSAQNADGGWGPAPSVPSSIEETALAIAALAAPSGKMPDYLRAPVLNALAWLASTTDSGRRFPPSPIGLYFARMWYSEALYPVIFTVGACEAAAAGIQRLRPFA